MLWRVRAVCTVVSIAATMASAHGQEGLEVKGDALGMSLDTFKQKYHRQMSGANAPAPFCSDSRPGQEIVTLLAKPWHAGVGVVTCSTHYPYEWIGGGEGPTLAGQKAQMFVYHFLDGVLYDVTVLFSRDGYAEVRSAFVAKYGEPDDSEVETLQNRLGATFTSENLNWSDGVGNMTLIERYGSIDRSALFLIDPLLADAVRGRAPEPRTDDI